jgi:hypothetical protein
MKSFNELFDQEGPILGLYLSSPDPLYLVEIAKGS